MTKQNQTVDTQATKKNKQINKPVIEQSTEDMALVQELPGSVALLDQPGVQDQAGRLADPRWSTIQRQMLAQQIGQNQGNQHLQRVIAASQHNGQTTPLASGQYSPAKSSAPKPVVQPKLAVNEPDDQYEQEADAVADAVMRMPAAETPPDDDEQLNASSSIQFTTLQMSGNDTPEVTPNLETNINALRGGGDPLSTEDRTFFEGRMGADFSDVRVHTNDTAVQTAQDLDARAYTVGSDIAFNAGEYQPATDNGRQLLAHELTHVVQQGGASNLQRKPESELGVCPVCGKRGVGTCPGCGEEFVPVQRSVDDTVPPTALSTIQQGTVSRTIQRWSAPAQDVTTEGRAERPDDGAEVEGRMQDRIENDPNMEDADDLSEEEREEAQEPDRGEVHQESGEITSSGESSPSVDRGGEAQQVTEAEQAQIEQGLQEQAPEGGEGEAEGEEASVDFSEAEAAAQRAEAAQQASEAVEIPEEPEPFNHPNVEAPVDSAGEALPRKSQTDTQVRGLGYIAEMLRVKGYQMKRSAAEQERGSYELDSILEQEREDLANAQQGTATMDTHNQARQQIAQQSREAHTESVERQQFVAEEAPNLASEADEGQQDSGELAAESRSRADQSESEIPDDPDARADAEQQSGEMQNSAEQAQTMDQAIIQTGERARQYQQDAAEAAEQNQLSETQIASTEDVIAQTGARIEEMHAANESSQQQIDEAGPGPALIREFAQETAESGDELIAATYVMEEELTALQDEYLADMAGIESREEAEQRLLEEQEEQETPPEASPEEEQLFELAGMNEEEQEQHIAQMEQPERDGLLATLDRMIQEAPDQGTDATEGARLSVDTGLSQAIMGEQPSDPRAQQIQEVENQRTERVGGVLDIADQNMTYLTEAQQQQLANRLVAESITDDIANIDVLQMGKDMIIGMIDPRQSLTSVVGGFEKMLGGFANIGNMEAWQRDPLGNLLQIAADITTGLAMIFSTILGIAAMITALMVALTILSWGTLSWMTGPVIGWMGTVMTYAGWGAIISGGLAVYFNYLCYIKNLHDAGTATTARELFGNTEQMKQNASDGFQGAMAVVEGIGAVKMGPSLSSGEFFSHVPRSPGQWARQTIDSVADTASSLASAPSRIARGARELFEGGREGLMRFKERVQNLFRRRRPGGDVDIDVDLDTPQARQQHQSHLDDARNQRLGDMDEPEFRAEMTELAENRPRRIDPDSEFAQRYDVEIESNGHTYRRNRDGSGWCRFSAEECGIPDDALPDSVRQNIPESPIIDPNTNRPVGEAPEPLIDPNTNRPIGEAPEPLIDPNTNRPIGEATQRPVDAEGRPVTEIITEEGSVAYSDLPTRRGNNASPIRTTVDPDGTITTVNTGNGNTTIQHPDGTQIFREGNGSSVTVKSPDGTTTIHRADGTVYRIDSDGTTTVTRPDGTTTTTTPGEAPISDTSGIIDDDARRHILEGDRPGSGGHGPGAGRIGKSEFPQGWSDERILSEISDIATNPNATWTQQGGVPGATHYNSGRPVRWTVEATVDGVDITVIVEPHGRGVITGFPTNVPQNPIVPGS